MDKRPILEYGVPRERSWLDRALKVGAGYVAVAAALVAALMVPHPEGIWYFGRHPQWVICIVDYELTIGSIDHPASLGVVPLIVAKLLAFSLPVYLVLRHRAKSRTRRPSP